MRGGSASIDDPVFRRVCRDVLTMDTAKVTRGGHPVIRLKVDEIIEKVCRDHGAGVGRN
jgi:hypothetical protein